MKNKAGDPKPQKGSEKDFFSLAWLGLVVGVWVALKF